MREIMNQPLWASENPYLPILENRFFSSPDSADWSDLPRRVARLFLNAELSYTPEANARVKAQQIHDLVSEGAFLPNSPVMMNTESMNNVNLFACHVLSPPNGENDLEIADLIHDGCGGIGYDFSKQTDPVHKTILVEEHTESLNSTRKRKAHSAVTLHVSHPQIYPFIEIGRKLTITHTNVELDEVFFESLDNKESRALDVWEKICTSIQTTGKPAIAFAANKSARSNNGEPLILNVCGESLLRENESSIIGSLNLSRYILGGQFNEEKFRAAARLAVCCLDNLHDHQSHASQVVSSRCKESRKIGIGIMGYADALLMMGMRYGSTAALDFTNHFMSVLKEVTQAESEALANARGGCLQDLLSSESRPRRNASLMAIPANGTLSLIANVTGGIEPVFSFLQKQVVDGQVVYQLQPTLRRLLIEKGSDPDYVCAELKNGRSLDEIRIIDPELRATLVTANELTTQDHIITQATFQKYIDGGISKTINLSHKASYGDISNAILMAREQGCVGVSLYRDGSHAEQPTQSFIAAV